MKIHRFFGIVIAVASALLILPMAFEVEILTAYAGAGDYYASDQIAVTEVNVPDENNAYIIFSQPEQKRGMDYIFVEDSKKEDLYYSEPINWKGIPARQVYSGNYFTFRMDESFASEDDQVFTFIIDYWDYGGGGYFYIDYIPKESNEIKTIQVLKLGMENGQKTEGRWFRVTINVDDACFDGRMEGGTDFRIRQGAYNSFSKIEIRNLSRDAGPTESFGTYNEGKAEALHLMGLYDGYGEGEAFAPSLDRELTYEEAVVHLITSYGLKEKALLKNIVPSDTGVSSYARPYVGLAESMGIIAPGEAFKANEIITQKELICLYLNLLEIEYTNSDDVYSIARKYGLLSQGSMLFQPQRNANIDALVCLAVNAFVIDNPKTGYNAMNYSIENGIYDVSELLTQTTDSSLRGWATVHPFKAPKKKYIDPYTGRVYYTLGIFGQSTTKPYFTQNCIASDNKRIYASVGGSIVEYNIETEMCRYVSGEHSVGSNSGFIVTPLDNLWFVNSLQEIVKVNLSTYEITVVTSVPEWQKTGHAEFVQVNNDESYLNLYWEDDKSGEINNDEVTRFPILDLKTLEWDLSHQYGFDTDRKNPNHVCMNPNPEYSNYMFFAHEGNGYFSLSNEKMNQHSRVWMVNTDTDEYYNVFQQKWAMQPKEGDPTSGRISEGAGHEFWSADGEWLGFVRHDISVLGRVTFNDGNICFMRPDGTDKWYVPADLSCTITTTKSSRDGLTHCNISYDHRWTVSDTIYSSSFGWTDAVLVDNYTGKTHFLARVSQSGSNPGHFHPQFSPDGKLILFGLWSEDKKHALFGWMDVSDITENGAPGGRFDVSDSCESFSFEGDFDHYVEPIYDSNKNLNGVRIPSGKEMYVDVKKTVVENDNTPATITIKYKDNGITPITFTYYTWTERSYLGRNSFKENTITIQRKGTGRTLTKTLRFDDICLGNMQILRSDFRIGAAGSDATILSVDVSVPNRKEVK